MKPTPPIFSGHGHVYTADVCPALREAADKGSVRFNAYGRGHYPGTEHVTQRWNKTHTTLVTSPPFWRKASQLQTRVTRVFSGELYYALK